MIHIFCDITLFSLIIVKRNITKNTPLNELSINKLNYRQSARCQAKKRSFIHRSEVLKPDIISSIID